MVADVGTDHGYLICRLVESGKSPGGVACDINPQPLEKAKSAIQSLGLENRIHTALSDGLLQVEPAWAQEIVIAGMGGDLIWEILSAVEWTWDEGRHLILQPMTKAHRLRRSLLREGFSILREEPAKVGKFLYPVMSARYTGERREPGDLEIYCGRMPESSSSMAAEYLEWVRRRIVLVRAEGLAKAGMPEAFRYKKLAEDIKSEIDRMRSESAD